MDTLLLDQIRYRARTIAGVTGNFRQSHVNNKSCRLWSLDSDETQEHFQLYEGTKFEKEGAGSVGLERDAGLLEEDENQDGCMQ